MCERVGSPAFLRHSGSQYITSGKARRVRGWESPAFLRHSGTQYIASGKGEWGKEPDKSLISEGRELDRRVGKEPDKRLIGEWGRSLIRA